MRFGIPAQAYNIVDFGNIALPVQNILRIQGIGKFEHGNFEKTNVFYLQGEGERSLWIDIHIPYEEAVKRYKQAMTQAK